MLRMRRDRAGTVYYQCDIGAAGWGGPPTHVLYLAQRPGFWLAIHAPTGASLDELLKAPTESIIFSCCNEDILTPGEHNWTAPP